MSSFKDKQNWVKTMQARMDSKSQTLPQPYPHPFPSKSLNPKSSKKPSKLTPLSNPPNFLQKSSEIASKGFSGKEMKANVKENDIPEVGEWEFEEEMEQDVWDMMEGFDEKISKKKKGMSELEKMELEHKKLVNMTDRLKKK